MHKGSFKRPRRGYVGLTIKVPSKSPKRTTVTYCKGYYKGLTEGP